VSTAGVVIAQSPEAPDLSPVFWDLIAKHQAGVVRWLRGGPRPVYAGIYGLPQDRTQVPAHQLPARERALAQAESMAALLREARALPAPGWKTFEAAARVGISVDACLLLAVDAAGWQR
jgi:hypothetical protein